MTESKGVGGGPVFGAAPDRHQLDRTPVRPAPQLWNENGGDLSCFVLLSLEARQQKVGHRMAQVCFSCLDGAESPSLSFVGCFGCVSV